MKITPLDIQQVGFRIKMRGYDRSEVDAFLDSLTEEYEGLVREANALREKVAEYESQEEEIKKKEAALNSTLLKAQGMIEEMKRTAQKEADLIIREADLKAESICVAARDHLAALKRETLDLQKQKIIFMEKFRSLIRTFERIAEAEEREEERGAKKDRSEEEKDDNVRLIKPKA
ncbi:MAG TPA: DivIVA domain-containing protein [Nitrospiria bacterium]